MRRWNHEGTGSNETGGSGWIRPDAGCLCGSSIKRVDNWQCARKHTHSTARAQHERQQWPVGSGGNESKFNKSKFFHALSTAGPRHYAGGRRFTGASQTGEFGHNSSGKQWATASLPGRFQRKFRQQEEGQKG